MWGMLASLAVLTLSHVAGFAFFIWYMLRSDDAALPPEYGGGDGPPPPDGSPYLPRWPSASWRAEARDHSSVS